MVNANLQRVGILEAGGAAFGILGYEDTFTEASNTGIASHLADVGPNPSYALNFPIGSTSFFVNAATDKLRRDATISGFNNYRCEVLGTFSNDIRFEAELWNNSLNNGIICRYTHFSGDDGFTGYLLWALASNGGLRLYRADNGSLTQLGSTAAMTYSAGQKLKIEAIGTTIKGYYNDVELISVTDATYGSGQLGFRAAGSNSSVDRFDNAKAWNL